MSDSKWYVLKVVGGQEKKVKTFLDAERVNQKLESQIEQILIPVDKVYEMRGGKRQTKERQFFPGYLLLCANLTDSRVMDLVRATPSALGFLGVRGWGLSKPPVPLRQAEVHRIVGSLDASGESTEGPEGALGKLSLEEKFAVGEAVKVIDGPFSGFVGSVQEIFDERKKLSVAVKIFERNTPVELGYGQVKKFS